MFSHRRLIIYEYYHSRKGMITILDSMCRPVTTQYHYKRDHRHFHCLSNRCEKCNEPKCRSHSYARHHHQWRKYLGCLRTVRQLQVEIKLMGDRSSGVFSREGAEKYRASFREKLLYFVFFPLTNINPVKSPPPPYIRLWERHHRYIVNDELKLFKPRCVK